jgi:flagellar hook-length control protein FliK
MQLQPEELGQIDIKLKLNEGKLIIDIVAANSKTQALLTNQVDKLIASMGLQNVQVESVHVSQQMNQESNGGQNQWQSMNSGMDFSQQRNQEQMHKETHHEGSMIGSSRTSTEVQETIPVMIQNLRQYNLHRLNYSV